MNDSATKPTRELPEDLVGVDGLAKEAVSFPGYAGLPFRGTVPFLRDDDPEYRQPKVAHKAHTSILELSEMSEEGLKDIEYYRGVMQACANGHAVLHAEDRQYDEAIKGWRVMLTWFEVFTRPATAVDREGLLQ